MYLYLTVPFFLHNVWLFCWTSFHNNTNAYFRCSMWLSNWCDKCQVENRTLKFFSPDFLHSISFIWYHKLSDYLGQNSLHSSFSLPANLIPSNFKMYFKADHISQSPYLPLWYYLPKSFTWLIKLCFISCFSLLLTAKLFSVQLLQK